MAWFETDTPTHTHTHTPNPTVIGKLPPEPTVLLVHSLHELSELWLREGELAWRVAGSVVVVMVGYHVRSMYIRAAQTTASRIHRSGISSE
ncbi:hypothetical protein E2C01_017485 [Portunus trituberculatus]|uniref:Uncharacterized protein n=1 Tax=Portunus trituberculatus TaxID=210409 RepID=A0A5B7DTL3_PORTR|nr:hypothetical protein [Portunus trituberculatus]